MVSAARRSWVIRGVAKGVVEEARTRGFASLTFVSFALSRSYYLTPAFTVNSGKRLPLLHLAEAVRVDSLRIIELTSVSDQFLQPTGKYLDG